MQTTKSPKAGERTLKIGVLYKFTGERTQFKSGEGGGILRRKRLEKGRYQVGDVIIARNDPPKRTGHHLVTTWRNERTNEMLGYTLAEAVSLLSRRTSSEEGDVRGRKEFRAVPCASHVVAVMPLSRAELRAIKNADQLRKDRTRMEKFATDLSKL